MSLPTGFFLAGVYPPTAKLLSTWFREGRGLALGILAAAIVVGNGLPHLVNGLGGLDWRLVIVATSALTVFARLLAEFAVGVGTFPFPRATFDPREAARVLSNRGVRLATTGLSGICGSCSRCMPGSLSSSATPSPLVVLSPVRLSPTLRSEFFSQARSGRGPAASCPIAGAACGPLS